MKAEAILELARSRGIILSCKGNQILFRGPQGAMSPELKQGIAEHKAEIVEILQREQVAFMSLEDFGKGNYAVKIFSRVLNKEIYFCSNEVMRDSISHTGRVAYLPGELNQLVKLQPDGESLKRINNIREVFPNSQIIGDEARTSLGHKRGT